MKQIALLGSTGSIGLNTLRVVAEFPGELSVAALAAGRNLAVLAEQAIRFRPRLISVAHESDVPLLRSLLSDMGAELGWLEIVHGADGLRRAATGPDVDMVVCAVAGSAGLIPALAALQAGKQLALATKEALVMAGEILMQEAHRQGTEILPVDSEHNAIHQCLRGEARTSIKRLILTASGGPFRATPAAEFEAITPERALQHPVWRMGRKITIDSATLMNKGLEVMEAHWLFGVPAGAIEVLIHPQSAVHSLVEMIDGSIMAQLGIADMRVAIQYVLTYPARRSSSLPSLDLQALGRLDFEAPDLKKFPCVGLAYAALRECGTMPAVLNAANEVGVQAFLEGRIGFTEIAELIERTMDSHQTRALESVETVLEADSIARDRAEQLIPELKAPMVPLPARTHRRGVAEAEKY